MKRTNSDTHLDHLQAPAAVVAESDDSALASPPKVAAVQPPAPEPAEVWPSVLQDHRPGDHLQLWWEIDQQHFSEIPIINHNNV